MFLYDAWCNLGTIVPEFGQYTLMKRNLLLFNLFFDKTPTFKALYNLIST